jgi:hypothetical protein
MGLLIKLLNGDTNLKSLKFGKDQLGGADSNQPFIQTPIGEPEQPGFASSDSILRGGITAPIHAAIDVVRLTKYFTTPGGLGFVTKQNILSRAAVKTEVGGFLNEGVYNPLSTLAQAGVGFLGTHFEKQGLIPGVSRKTYEEAAYSNNNPDTNIILGYNSEGAIANAVFTNRLLDIWLKKQEKSTISNNVIDYGGGPGSILGIGKTKIHFAKDGDGNAVRTGINNSLYTNLSTRKLFEKGGNPRLPTEVDYRKLLQASLYYGDYTSPYNPKKNEVNILDLQIENQSNLTGYNNPQYENIKLKNIFLSGSKTSPHLIEQVKEKIYTKYKSTILEKLKEFDRHLISDTYFDPVKGQYGVVSQLKPSSSLDTYSSENTLRSDFSGSSDNTEGKYKDTGGVKPHKTGYLANLDKNAGIALNTSGKIILLDHNPYRFGGRGIAPDFRKTDRNIRGFNDPISSYDTITTSSSYESLPTLDKIYYDTSANKRTSTPLSSDKDIIPFKIGIINPENPTGNPTKITFRAYIDTLADSYDAGWTKQTYMGRAEAFHKYTSFNRDISLGFTVAAESKQNLNIMYNQLNTLVSSLAPTYTTGGYMAGNIHQLTIGDYVKNQYGIISSMNLQIMDESPWGIDEGLQLPYYIKVTGIKFTPIHNFRPSYGDGDRFIKQ